MRCDISHPFAGIVEGETKASKRTALGGRGNWSRRYTSLSLPVDLVGPGGVCT